MVGHRKPEAAIFRVCLDRLNVAPNEALFLDDIGSYLKGAQEMGMHTLKVRRFFGKKLVWGHSLAMYLPVGT